MMKRKLLYAGAPLALAVALAFAGPAPASPPSIAAFAPGRPSTAAQPVTGAEQAQIVAAASAALNRISGLQGRFRQINPDGSASSGKVWLQRPGRLRFEYDAPNPLVIVADGATVAVEDRALKAVDRVPLRSTPLHFVLKKDVDLAKDARIVRVLRAGDATLVTLRDRSGETDGELTLAFEGSDYALRRWTVIDGMGDRTELELVESARVARLDPKLFRVADTADPTSRQRVR